MRIDQGGLMTGFLVADDDVAHGLALAHEMHDAVVGAVELEVEIDLAAALMDMGGMVFHTLPGLSTVSPMTSWPNRTRRG